MQRGDTAVEVRTATPADADVVREVHTLAVTRLCAADYTPGEIDGWVGARAIRGGWAALAPGSRFVATIDGAVVGFAAIVDDEIHAVYVHPAHVRRGVGAALLTACERAAARGGAEVLRLSASITAVPFYLACGYVRIRDATHALRSGVCIRCVEMSKALPPCGTAPPPTGSSPQ